MKPRLLDLFCGAGGCSVGYARAGFEVFGVDINPQPNYPFEFIQADALQLLRHGGRYERTHNRYQSARGAGTGERSPQLGCDVDNEHRPPPDIANVPDRGKGSASRDRTAWHGGIDAIHASPPCQAYSAVTGEHRDKHPDLVENTRLMLRQTGPPYVIENVVGAPLIDPVQLCGSSFGLPLQRHRLFETNFALMAPPCAHGALPARFDVYEHGRWYKSPFAKVYGSGGGKAMEHWPEAMGIDWMTHAEMAEAIPPVYTEHIGGYLLAHLNTLTELRVA